MKIKFNFKLNHAIALIPFIGYLSAYFYEVGIFTFYNISEVFVQVTIEQVILATIFTSAFVAIIGLLITIFLKTRDNNNTPVRPTKNIITENIIAILIILIVLNLLMYYFDIALIYKILMIVGFDIALPILVFIPPLYKFPKTSSYKEKFYLYSLYLYQDKLKEKKTKVTKINLLQHLYNSPLKNFYLPAISLVIWIFCTYTVGFLTYSDSTKFPVYNLNSDKYIVVGIRSEYLLVTKFNNNEMRTTGEIKYIPLTNVSITNEEIGRINQVRQSQNK